MMLIGVYLEKRDHRYKTDDLVCEADSLKVEENNLKITR